MVHHNWSLILIKTLPIRQTGHNQQNNTVKKQAINTQKTVSAQLTTKLFSNPNNNEVNNYQPQQI